MQISSKSCFYFLFAAKPLISLPQVFLATHLSYQYHESTQERVFNNFLRMFHRYYFRRRSSQYSERLHQRAGRVRFQSFARPHTPFLVL